MKGILKQFHDAHPEVDIPVVFASTPDYKGSMEDGFAAAGGGVWRAMLQSLPEAGDVDPQQVTLLPSSAYGPGDVEEAEGNCRSLWPDSHRSGLTCPRRWMVTWMTFDFYTTPTGRTTPAGTQSGGTLGSDAGPRSQPDQKLQKFSPSGLALPPPSLTN